MLYFFEFNYFDVVEIEKFYYVLSFIGIDFILMLKVFLNKTRVDLKVIYFIQLVFIEFFVLSSFQY